MLDKQGNRIPVEARLTTSDNRFDPFDEFDEWQEEDLRLGHRTSEELARAKMLFPSSDDWPYEEQLFANEDAIDFVVKLNLSGKYQKVTREY